MFKKQKCVCTTLCGGLVTDVSMCMWSCDESIISSSCFFRLLATVCMALVHSSLQQQQQWTCKPTLHSCILYDNYCCFLRHTSFSVEWAVNEEHMYRCMHVSDRSSGLSTWKVRSMTVVHCRQRMMNVLGLGRSVFISWHSGHIRGKPHQRHGQGEKWRLRSFIFICVFLQQYITHSQ